MCSFTGQYLCELDQLARGDCHHYWHTHNKIKAVKVRNLCSFARKVCVFLVAGKHQLSVGLAETRGTSQHRKPILP